MKIKNAGPPNQFFRNDASSSGSVSGPVENEDEEEEEGCEPIEDGAVIKNDNDGQIGTNDPPSNDDILAGSTLTTDQSCDGSSTDGKWSWMAFFKEINIDERGSAIKTNPGLKYGNPAQMKHWKAINFFNYFVPWDFLELHVIPVTNAAIEESRVNKILTLPELKRFFGVWFLMSLHPQYSLDEFFYQEPRKDDKKNGEKKRKRDDFGTRQSAVSLCPAIVLRTFLLTFGFRMILLQFIVIEPGQSAPSSNHLMTTWSLALNPPG